MECMRKKDITQWIFASPKGVYEFPATPVFERERKRDRKGERERTQGRAREGERFRLIAHIHFR